MFLLNATLLKKQTKFLFNYLFPLVLIAALFFTACDDDDNFVAPMGSYQASFNMKQMVNGMALQMNTSNKPYTTAKGQKFNVDLLQYLISDITFF
ncbi:MAG: hypothetical protein CMO34_03455 [Verrucomicrobia bacterium]|nr:hypothetical protein [Verrucomicrobiota bacterium]